MGNRYYIGNIIDPERIGENINIDSEICIVLHGQEQPRLVRKQLNKSVIFSFPETHTISYGLKESLCTHKN